MPIELLEEQKKNIKPPKSEQERIEEVRKFMKSEKEIEQARKGVEESEKMKMDAFNKRTNKKAA